MIISDNVMNTPSSIFQKHILEIIYLTQLKNDVFCQKLLLLVHSYFCNAFLKNVFQKYIETLFSGYACRFKQFGCFRSFHFVYMSSMPSVYIRSKHESLSTLHGAMCVNFLNRFPNALLEDFEKVLKIYIPASRTRTLKSDALKLETENESGLENHNQNPNLNWNLRTTRQNPNSMH